MTCDQPLMLRNPLFIRKALEDEILRLPLQDVGHLATQVIEQGLSDIGPVADVHPFFSAVETVHSGLLGRVAHHACPGEKKPLLLVPLHCES